MQIFRLATALRPRGTEGDLALQDQLALAFAASAVPRLRRWKDAQESVEAEIRELEEQIERIRSPLAEATRRFEDERDSREEELLRLRAELQQVEGRPWSMARPIWLLLFGGSWRIQRDAARKRLERKQRSLDALLERRNNQISDLRARLEDLRAQRERLEPVPRVIDGLRALDCVFLPRVVSIDGDAEKGAPSVRWVLLDPLGETTTLEAPEIGLPGEEVTRLARELRAIDLGGVLLSGDEDEEVRAGDDRLSGAEADLVDVARGLSTLVQSTRAKTLEIPVLEPDSDEVGYLTDLLDGLDVRGAETVSPSMDRESSDRVSKVARTADELDRLLSAHLATPGAFFSELATDAGRVADAVGGARARRRQSGDVLAERARRIRRNALLGRYQFFCPACNADPEYLSRVFGLDAAHVKRMDTERLRPALMRYLESRLESGLGEGAVETRPNLRARWGKALRELAHLEDECRAYQTELHTLEEQAAFTPEAEARKKAVSRLIGDRKGRYAAAIDALLARPVSLPPQDAADTPARRSLPTADTHLSYDPGGSETPWSCSRCSAAFTLEEALLGAVDRVRQEVVYPLVTSLWSHPSVAEPVAKVVRAAEEELKQRSAEAVADAQGPITRFRNDAEGLRERVRDAQQRGRQVTGRLLKVAEQYEEFGLLPSEELERLRDLARQSRNRMDDALRALERVSAGEQEMRDVVSALEDPEVQAPDPAHDFIARDLASVAPAARFGESEGPEAASTEPSGPSPGIESQQTVPIPTMHSRPGAVFWAGQKPRRSGHENRPSDHEPVPRPETSVSQDREGSSSTEERPE